MANRPRVLVSACLLGVRCRYDGGGRLCPGIGRLAARAELIPVCPEQLGGLPTPRPAAEILGERVITREGADVTAAFHRGAEEVCRLAALFGAQFALLKQRSPSCGCGEVYDGSFAGRAVPGSGVTARQLADMGMAVFPEDRLDDLLDDLDDERKDDSIG